MSCSNVLKIRSFIHLHSPVFDLAGMPSLTGFFEFMILSIIVFSAVMLADLVEEVKRCVRMAICAPKSE
jgi:hypothetical protein